MLNVYYDGFQLESALKMSKKILISASNTNAVLLNAVKENIRIDSTMGPFGWTGNRNDGDLKIAFFKNVNHRYNFVGQKLDQIFKQLNVWIQNKVIKNYQKIFINLFNSIYIKFILPLNIYIYIYIQ